MYKKWYKFFKLLKKINNLILGKKNGFNLKGNIEYNRINSLIPCFKTNSFKRDENLLVK